MRIRTIKLKIARREKNEARSERASMEPSNCISNVEFF